MNAELLSADLDYQLKHSAAIRQFSYSIFTGEHKGEFLRNDYIGLALFNRCLQTHEAVEVVVRRSLIDDAWVLVRTLVENSVNCAYMIAIADAQTADDYVDYAKFKRYEDLRVLKSTNESLFSQSYSAEDEDVFRKLFESVSPRFQNRRGDRWCVDDRLYKRAARVDAKISEGMGEPHSEYLWIVNSVWRHGGSHVHGMADTPAYQTSPVEDGVVVQRRYEKKEGAAVLHSSNLALYLSALLVDIRLCGKNGDEIKRRLYDWGGLS